MKLLHEALVPIPDKWISSPKYFIIKSKSCRQHFESADIKTLLDEISDMSFEKEGKEMYELANEIRSKIY